MNLERICVFVHDKHSYVANRRPTWPGDPARRPSHKLKCVIIEVHFIRLELASQLHRMLKHKTSTHISCVSGIKISTGVSCSKRHSDSIEPSEFSSNVSKDLSKSSVIFKTS